AVYALVFSDERRGMSLLWLGLFTASEPFGLSTAPPFLRSIRRLLRASLFPYTTLFRSAERSIGGHDRHPADRVLHQVMVGELSRSEEHTSELQSRVDLVCRLLLEKKKTPKRTQTEEEKRKRRNGERKRAKRDKRATLHS